MCEKEEIEELLTITESLEGTEISTDDMVGNLQFIRKSKELAKNMNGYIIVQLLPH